MLPIIYSWNSANTSGYTKRAMRNALTLMAFCAGNLIGPQMFQASDAPEYNPAKIALLASMAAVVVLALVLRQLMVRENAKRDRADTPRGENENENVGFLDLTDIENRGFRYVY